MYTAFFRNFCSFSSCASNFVLLRSNEQLWVQTANFICSPCLHCLHKTSFFPTLVITLTLHEHRELWQSCFKEKLIKSLAKKFWLMVVCLLHISSLQGSRMIVSARESTPWGRGLGCDMSWWKYVTQKFTILLLPVKWQPLFSSRIYAKACAAAQTELREQECEQSWQRWEGKVTALLPWLGFHTSGSRDNWFSAS